MPNNDENENININESSYDDEEKIEDIRESSEVLPFIYSITSYGADYPVDALVKRLGKKDVFIPPFQRGYVWTLRQASRFIESLLLGLPVPGIFLAKEKESQKLLVIDGHQRLKTLEYFYLGDFKEKGEGFLLKDVQEKFEGKSYKNLVESDRIKLDDSIIHATIVKQEEPSEDISSIYHIFERLNTGGSLLQPQEIRACIYHGEFNELLNQLNTNKNWRSIYGKISERLKDRELILRFFALCYRYSFTWDKIPESDNQRLIEFLTKKLGVDWVKRAKIEKIDDGKVIRVYTEKNSLMLRLSDEKTNVYLEINGHKTDEFAANMENGKLNVYYFGYDIYKRPMKSLLNSFMGENRNLDKDSKEELTALFNNTIEIIYKSMGAKSFRPIKALNAAVYDAVMVGVAVRLYKGEIKNLKELNDKYLLLLANPSFQETYKTNTSDEKIVKGRIKYAIDVFKDVQ